MARIVVAEDCDYQRELIVSVLTSSGHSCHGARDGEEALALALSESADLTVTDLYMPNCDGIELIRALRDSRPQMPIIALSSCPLGEGELFLKLARDLGATAVFVKPVSPSELTAAITKALVSVQVKPSEWQRRSIAPRTQLKF